jgi:hypothetical protein
MVDHKPTMATAKSDHYMPPYFLRHRARCRVEAWISALDEPGQPGTPDINKLLHASAVSSGAMNNIKRLQVKDDDTLTAFALRHFWDVKRTEVHEYKVPSRPTPRNLSTGRIEIAGLMAL